MANVENVSRVSYIYGILQQQGNFDDDELDMDDIIKICTNIATDWENFIDIENLEEEGYITAYAQRVLIEKFSKKPV